MTLDMSGILLEGIRYSTGNNVYTHPPDSVLISQNILNTMTERAEYAVIAGSLDPAKNELDIADPSLLFYWTRNDPGIVRFDYDTFSGRWLSMPGMAPRAVGDLSNSTRLTIPVPDPSKKSSAPFDLYIDETPRISFSLVFVGSGAFSDPSSLPSLTVEVNSSGQLNFSAVDTVLHQNKPVLFTGQSFVSRMQSKGAIGSLPAFSTTDYRIFMNPRPASGQTPRIRIGYGPYLTPIEVPTESSMGSVSIGTVLWSADTGKLKFSAADITANPEETVYYDGLFIGSAALSRQSGITLSSGWPNPSFNIPVAIGSDDSVKFIVFAEKSGNIRNYFSCAQIFQSSNGYPSNPPSAGWFYLDKDTGNVFLSASDVTSFRLWTFGYVDALLSVGAPGVAVRMRRSGANGPGPSVAPDFTVIYKVSQLLTDNIPGFPFMMLPTVPTVNSNLKLKVEMGTGKYVGNLVDATNPSLPGLGYLLDLDTKRLKFTYRAHPRAFTLPQSQSFIKLDNAALSTRGVQIKMNDVLLSMSDFDLNASAGVIEFVEPIGEGDANSRDISGSAYNSTFTATSPSFNASDINKRLLILTGSNSGIRDIIGVKSSTVITVDPPFLSAETVSASVRATDEIIADRIWAPVSSVPKRFSLYRSPTGLSGPFTKVDVGQYSVKENVGQVGFSLAARPGEVFRVNYVSLDTSDDGVTVTSTQRTETASFKISQEVPAYTVGSRTIIFNSAGKTLSLDSPVSLYIQGITQDPTTYSLSSPGVITLQNALTSGPVTIDYWVKEANGGELSFNLLYSPIENDSLKILGPVPGGSSGQRTLTVSGNQTNIFKPGGAILIENKDILYTTSSVYDLTSDITTISFAQASVADGSSIKVCDVINQRHALSFIAPMHTPSYMIEETNTVEIFVFGTNSVRIHGNSTSNYRIGTVIDFDDDPYWVLGSSYDAASNITTVSTAGSARRNYITPIVKRTIRPIADPLGDFSTLRSAHISRGFVLAKMGKTSSSVLQKDIDYSLGDDGIFKLRAPVTFGDILRVMYVARVFQPIGTKFEVNFAYEIAPDNSNGLISQQLRMDYDLHAPDSFFYRVETIVSLLPEAKSLATSNTSILSSGPNVVSISSQQTKDAGLPSPWYFSTFYQSMDVVASRFLKFYHDVINIYEDILSFVDGRIVGGSSGRFRYDGIVHKVTDYQSIKNDIDDEVKLYDTISMSSSFPLRTVLIPVYGKMSDPNVLSRLFPTVSIGAAYIQDIISSKNGDQVGSYKIKNITSVGTTTTSRASAFFTSSTVTPSGTWFTIDSTADAINFAEILRGGSSPSSGTNGDPTNLVSPFLNDQKIQVFDLEGNKLADGEILSIDLVNPYIVHTNISTPMPQIGGLAQVPPDPPDFSGDKNMQNMYVPGIDYTYTPDNGQILYFKMPSGFPFKNNPLVGNEIVEASVSFSNVDMKPKRVPALDGSEANDSGRLSIPRTRLNCELNMLLKELSLLRAGIAKHEFVGPNITVVSIFGKNLAIGDVIQFVDGPNSGQVATVSKIFPTYVVLNSHLTGLDLTGSSFIVGSVTNIQYTLNDEIKFLNFELACLDNAVTMFGEQISSGYGTSTSESVWTSSSSLSGTEGKLLWVKSGLSRGLWKISSASGNTVTVNSSPYPPLIAGATGQYSIINPWAFLQELEFKFVACFYRNTLTFLKLTQSFSPTYDDVVARATVVQQRQKDLSGMLGSGGNIPSLTSLLRDGDNLYDMRYLWIDQRTNKETGLLQLQTRATAQALDILTKITDNQRKALTLDAIA